MAVSNDHKEKPLPLTLDKWQWTARDEYFANTIIKATLGGGRAKGGFSARQNYYATLNNAPKPQGHRPRDPNAMDVDTDMSASRQYAGNWPERHRDSPGRSRGPVKIKEIGC